MLGGQNSLSNHNMEDSYINTPLAQALPVELELGDTTRPNPSDPPVCNPSTTESEPFGSGIYLTVDR